MAKKQVIVVTRLSDIPAGGVAILSSISPEERRLRISRFEDMQSGVDKLYVLPQRLGGWRLNLYWDQCDIAFTAHIHPTYTQVAMSLIQNRKPKLSTPVKRQTWIEP